MKTLNKLAAIVAILCTSAAVRAQVTIDSLTVQGYMTRANGTAVTDGTYSIAYGVRQNGSTIWGKTVSTVVTNGLFSASLSGTGTDLSAIPAGTSMNSDYSAVTLNPALLQASGNGGLVVRVYAINTINGSNPQFDITVNAVPTSYISSLAQGVVSGAVGLTGIATAAKASTSAGAGDTGKIVVLDAAGKIDGSMMPDPLPAVDGSSITNIDGANISSSSVAVGSIATTSKANTSAGVGDAGKIVLLNASGVIDSSMISGFVDLTSAQTVTGVKTLSNGVILKGSAPGNDNLDYFETVATCTPVPRGTTTAGTPTTSVAVCRYTRIGRVVHVSINLTWSALAGSAGTMAIGGLPYAAANITNLNQACAITVNSMTSPANSTVKAYIQPTESMIRLFSQVVATNVQAALAADTAASAQVQCNYLTD